MSAKNGKPIASSFRVVRNVGDLGHDVVTLAELQVQLLCADGKESAQRMVGPLLTLLTATLVLCSCIPLGLISIAQALMAADLSPTVAYCSATGIGLAIALVTGLAGWLWMKNASVSFERSKHEFSRNLTWLKQVLTSSDNRAATAATKPSRAADAS